MADYSNSTQRSLEYAPTWALATVSTVFVVISFAVERLLHQLGSVSNSFPPPPPQIFATSISSAAIAATFWAPHFAPFS
jgi:hypothetical protein